MGRPDFLIAGAGPAGALAARLLSDKGYRVRVYDPAPGFKPCGWAVPVQVERVYKIPGEAVLTEIRGFRVYLDGEPVHEEYGRLWGYIVDKPRMIASLLEGVEVEKRGLRLVPGDDGAPVVEAPPISPREGVIVATGSQALASGRFGSDRDMIYAVQTILPWRSGYDEDVIEMWFESSLVGYYWVFPRPGLGLDVGVGGYEEPRRLVDMLKVFVKKRFGVEASTVKGAWINIGGARAELLSREQPVIGEAAGFVYPISGEGIRPSMVSAKALIAMLEGGKRPSEFDSTVRWIGIQRRLLDRALSISPQRRAALLRSLPTRLFVSIGLGELSIREALAAAARLPAATAKLILEALKG